MSGINLGLAVQKLLGEQRHADANPRRVRQTKEKAPRKGV
jgi:hypothetical protein